MDCLRFGNDRQLSAYYSMFFLQVKNEVKSNNQYVTNEWASEIMCNSRSNIVLLGRVFYAMV